MAVVHTWTKLLKFKFTALFETRSRFNINFRWKKPFEKIPKLFSWFLVNLWFSNHQLHNAEYIKTTIPSYENIPADNWCWPVNFSDDFFFFIFRIPRELFELLFQTTERNSYWLKDFKIRYLNTEQWSDQWEMTFSYFLFLECLSFLSLIQFHWNVMLSYWPKKMHKITRAEMFELSVSDLTWDKSHQVSLLFERKWN